MANPKLLDKRRRSVKNIRKITRTMELIATARFKKAMDRASAASAYTDRMTQLVRDLMASGLEFKHPLLQPRESVSNATLLVLTANRGFCGGFNGNAVRAGLIRWHELKDTVSDCRLEVSGKKGIAAMKFRGYPTTTTFTQFDDKPAYDEVEQIGNRYLEEYITGRLDRLDIVYTKFLTVSRQVITVETLLPLAGIATDATSKKESTAKSGYQPIYEFLPSPESILEEIVPASFKVKLFKCFLDSAVSEQIARRVAMKSATDNADDMIRRLSMQYNRARQSRITSDLMDVIGGVEAIS